MPSEQGQLGRAIGEMCGLIVGKAGYDEPEPLAALEEAQVEQILRIVLTTMPLPMAEVAELLLGAWRT